MTRSMKIILNNNNNNRLIFLFQTPVEIPSGWKMSILQPAFNILIVCGCWIPPSCRTFYGKLLYAAYTTFVIFLLCSFCISQFLNVILNVRTAEELSDSFYMFIASILSCCKIFTLLVNHKAIRILSRKLDEEPCKPIDEQEITIRRRFDKSIGYMIIFIII